MPSQNCIKCKKEFWGNDFVYDEEFLCRSCLKEEKLATDAKNRYESLQRQMPFMMEQLLEKITSMESELYACRLEVSELKKHLLLSGGATQKLELASDEEKEQTYEELDRLATTWELQEQKEEQDCDAMVASIRAQNNNYWSK